MKKILSLILAVLCLCACAGADELPAPEIESGIRGEQFGIDKNINETTIDNYLGRSDAVYRDMRMLKDDANYEAIGGDSYLSGFVEGFEIVPYPYLVNVTGLPEEVGNPYQGSTLFTQTDGEYVANYEESMAVLEYLFPKDKVIFLMCGGGGYAGMTKNMLISLGWDETKIYNVGGFWYYEGNNRVDVKREEDDRVYYDFYKVAYHDIDFDNLTKINESGGQKAEDDKTDNSLNEITKDELQNLFNQEESFALLLYLPGCSSCANFKPVVKELSDDGQIKVYSITLDEAKELDLIKDSGVKYTPSLMLVKDGQILDYLDATADEDIAYYQDVESLSTWISNYFDIEIVKGNAKANVEDCKDACEFE